ncbi:ATP-binding protein [Pelagibaculum spongiae]|uniref:histidine kinase n=1 Tax=Pelagibaculum spongiae TaxID=2080658 RepID=A0A2V1GSL0_9GAMM|nr:ATP-binding protein [Pelagibaculum spongiae]PVZ68379.1 hypothetical protein DC094_13955 [Pelagibaculum spongiae]
MTRLFISLYIGFLLIVFSIFFSINLIDIYLFDDNVNQQYAEQFSAEVELIDQIIQENPSANLQALLDLVSNKNQQLITAIDKENIPPSILKALEIKKVWFDDNEFDYFRLDYKNQFYKIEINDNHPLIIKDDHSMATAMFILFLIAAMGSGIWLFSLHRKLSFLEQAANRFGSGNFTTRVSEKSRHKVGKLNLHFNQMAQQIEQLIASHKQLTNMVAHELRSPIFRLQLQVELLAESPQQQTEQRIQSLEEDLYLLQDLVDEFLQYNRLERPDQKIDLTVISLAELIQPVIQTIDSQIIKIHYSTNANSEAKITVDKNKTQRILKNLLENAQKYADNSILLSTNIINSRLIITVEDDGIGIDPSNFDKIFQPFCKLDKKSGYGLGLAICQRLLQISNGEIKAGTSSSLGGACFTISLPI